MPLSDNPFEPIAPERLAAIYRWPAEAEGFLSGEGNCLHVVGDAGMGKTALLLQLRLRLQEGGLETPYTCFPPDATIDVDAVALGDVTLLDETDRLTWRGLMMLLRRAKDLGHRIAMATHRDQRRDVERAGLSCVHLELAPLSSPEEVMRIFDDRVALAVGGQEHGYSLIPAAAEALWTVSRGNIERCLQLGYELFEDINQPRAITAEDVMVAVDALTRALG